MKRKNLIKALVLSASMLIVVFGFIFTSCSDLAVPTAIEIKASPELSVPVMATGTEKLDLGTRLANQLKNLAGDSEESNFKFYSLKHDATDDAMRFLLAMNMDFPFSSGEGESDIDISSLKNSLSKSITYGYSEETGELNELFSIPEISPDITGITLNYSDIASSAISQSQIDQSFIGLSSTDYEVSTSLSFEIILCSNDSEETFESIKFDDTKDSNVTLTFGKLTGNAARVSNVSMANKSASYPTDKDYIDLTDSNDNNRKCTIDLKGKTLQNKTKIEMTLTGKGVSDGQLSVTPNFSSINVSKISGFTKTGAIEITETSVSLGDDLPFKQATIATKAGSTEGGYLSIPLNGIETNAEGSALTLKMSMTQDSDDTYSGLDISNQTAENGQISLSGKNINSKNISLKPFIELTKVDVTFPVTITPSIVINKFSTVIIPESTIGNTSSYNQEINQDIGSIADTISKIYFKNGTDEGFGLKITVENKLPMDLSIGIYSNIMKQGTSESPVSKTFSKGQTTTESFITKEYNSRENALDFTEGTKLDANVTTELGFTGESPNRFLSITDVEPGTSYGLGLKIETVLDVKEAYIKLGEDFGTVTGLFPDTESGEEPIDLSAIGSYLGSNIYLSGIKTYAYIDDSGLLGDTSIGVKMQAKYTEGEETKTINFIDDSDESGKKNVYCSSIPTLSDKQDDDGFIVTTFDKDNATFTSGHFHEILKDAPSDFSFAYEITLTEDEGDGMWFDLSQLLAESDESDSEDEGESEESSSLGVSLALYIDFPIQLTIDANENGYAAIDIMSLINSLSSSEDSEEEATETDLLGRTSDSEDSMLSTLTDYIEKVGIKVNYTNSTGIPIGFAIIDGDNEEFKKTFTLLADGTSHSSDLEFDTSDFEYIMNTIPFSPDKMEIRLPGSTTESKVYTLKRDLGLNLVLIANVGTKIDHTISFGGSN